MPNREIKLAAAGAGVKLWQIADELGILDSNLSRKLRHELPAEEKARFMSIIEKLSNANERGKADAARKD